MKLPFRIVGRGRWESLRTELRTCRDGQQLLQQLQQRFDRDGDEPKLLRNGLVASLAAGRPAAVLDIGANVGTWTTHLARRFAHGTVHAVEADPRTFALLGKNLAGTTNVALHQLAMHSRSGKVTFQSHANNLLSSLLQLEDAAGKTNAVEVEAVTLDEFVRTRVAACPALIKIDTEGNDLEVLNGATATLQDPRLRALVMEFGFDPDNRRQVPIQRLVEHLLPAGFRVHEIDLAGVYQGRLYGNVLFSRHGA